MSTFDLIPQGWFSWDFNVLRDGSPVAEIDISSWWWEKGKLIVDGSTYNIRRDGPIGPFLLEGVDGTQVAVAKKNAWRHSFTVQHEDTTYTLQAASSFGRRFVVLENNQEIGSIARSGFFTRKATADPPDKLPLPVGMFLLWLTAVLWRRQNEAAVAAASG